ncbi:hypothetical protein GMSM_20950 [Geomonas sp. Red276]
MILSSLPAFPDLKTPECHGKRKRDAALGEPGESKLFCDAKLPVPLADNGVYLLDEASPQ